MNKQHVFFKLYLSPESWQIMIVHDTIIHKIDDSIWKLDKTKKFVQELLKDRVIVGHDIKFRDLSIFYDIITTNKTPFELYNSDCRNKRLSNFLFLDLNEFAPNLYMYGACKGLSVKECVSVEEQMEVDYTILRNLFNQFQMNIELKTMFMMSDSFHLKDCLQTNINSLTAKALSTNKQINDDGNYLFTCEPQLMAYLKKWVPIELQFVVFNKTFAELKALNEKQGNILVFNAFENRVTFGLGGAHSVHDTIKVFHSNAEFIIEHDDGDAYYPNLMIQHNTLSRVANKDKFIRYKTDRDIFKKSEPKSKKTLSLKIKNNAVYGQSAFKFSPLYDPFKQIHTCILGQLIIIAYSMHLYSLGATILQTNTDGLYSIKPTKNADLFLNAINEVSTVSRIPFDSDPVQSLWQKNVNNYLKVYPNGNIEAKGSTLCGDYKNDSISNKSYAIVHLAVKEYLINGTPLMQTIKSKDDLSWYCMTTVNKSFDKMFYGKLLNNRPSANNLLSQINSHHYQTGKITKNLTTDLKQIENGTLIKSNVARLVPVTDKLDRRVIMITGDKLQLARQQTKNMMLLDEELSKYDIKNIKIDYEFLCDLAEKRLEFLNDTIN